MSARDGGPAFPAPDFAISGEVSRAKDRGELILRLTDLRGMSVRQFYKAHALAGLLASFTGNRGPTNAECVGCAASLADAMLSEDAEFAAKAGAP